MSAFETDDVARMRAIFGPDAEKEMSSGDPVSDRHDREVMAVAMRQSSKWNPIDANRSELVIGDEQWPFPIPLAKAGSEWEFDSDAGKEELLSRRVGRNELKAIEVCRAYVRFQQEYASQPRDGKAKKGLYTQKLRSTPAGRTGCSESRQARTNRGARWAASWRTRRPKATTNKASSEPFYGYYFRVLAGTGSRREGRRQELRRQGPDVGRLRADRLSRRVRCSGVMSFIVNQDGVVYETDLGDDTAKIGPTIATFDPGEGWSEVKLPS